MLKIMPGTEDTEKMFILLLGRLYVSFTKKCFASTELEPVMY